MRARDSVDQTRAGGTTALLAFIAALFAAGCSGPKPAPLETGPATHVLVVVNTASTESTTIGEYYAKRRVVPNENTVLLNAPDQEEISDNEFESEILQPLRAKIEASRYRVDYIVLTKGIPIRIHEGGYSIDGRLAAMDLPTVVIPSGPARGMRICQNPYFKRDEPFDSRKLRMFLVTRLDGYTTADCLKLVDDSLAAKPERGPFFFNPAANRSTAGYGPKQVEMHGAWDYLKEKGFDAEYGKPGVFEAPAKNLAGYCSWGSNDSAYKADVYHRLRFKPGALAETFVSTSGRTFTNRNAPGQSLVADLIEQGVTGVKGYVSEPFTFALADPRILWDRYTRGYNLAESFYMASAVVRWKDVVIGDPLCRPYGR
jgi:uncharacterized protein (TIGR03790 family)